MASPVADALVAHLDAQRSRGAFDRAAIAGATESETRRRFVAHGIEPTADLVAYFSVLHHLDDAAAHRVFDDRPALDLAGALDEYTTLRSFATEMTEDLGGDDPDEVFPPWHFPISRGKPTTLVDLRTGEVLERWWDEDVARPVADDLTSWLTAQTTSRAERPSDPADVAPSVPLVTQRFDFLPGQSWIRVEPWAPEVLRRLSPRSRATVDHHPTGSVQGNLALEAVQADLVARLLKERFGFADDQIELREEAHDDRPKHTVTLTVHDDD